MGITWLASYPKSGNTWVRFILSNALYGPTERSIDVNRRIPDMHRRLPDDRLNAPDDGAPLLAKTHFELTGAHPELSRTDRALHIVRNPRDVLLSALNYRRLNGVTPAQLSDKAYAEMFIRAGGDPTWKQQKFGTWASHAASWTGTDAFPVRTIRYEDLKADTMGVMRDAIDFMGLQIDDATLERAIKASSFESLRAIEIREKADPKRKDGLFLGDTRTSRQGVFFMNKGLTGQSLDKAIAPGLDAMLDAALGDVPARFGYGSG
ncbi:MAG: sulfotransferase domain-containing protein [Phycisphaerales bacterium JB059]